MTYRPRPANSLLSVSFLMDDRPVKVRAMVLYNFTSASGPLKEPGMGMKFVEISDEDREFIRSFIREQITASDSRFASHARVMHPPPQATSRFVLSHL